MRISFLFLAAVVWIKSAIGRGVKCMALCTWYKITGSPWKKKFRHNFLSGLHGHLGFKYHPSPTCLGNLLSIELRPGHCRHVLGQLYLDFMFYQYRSISHMTVARLLFCSRVPSHPTSQTECPLQTFHDGLEVGIPVFERGGLFL